ncbi:hypothetical protein CYMTET_13548 [Cymbomonas tetramitiformis]|uniref:Uncharacterized protein n=1 Tax=Cymbomonas tetramitiformis TaxID=36881 RepID=A0AAE0GI90_9CHLO|nr:hypothetical protein CYMTET_13548 [Cymbomonas tetramitiformis]
MQRTRVLASWKILTVFCGTYALWNRAAAKLRPVTQQGLERVSRSFGQAVSDAGVRYSTEWEVEFCWRAAARARAQIRDFREQQRVLDRFRTLMKGGVAAGLLLNNLGGKLVSAVQRTGDTQHGVEVAAEMESTEVARKMKLAYKGAGLDQVATFFLDGSFGVLYLIVKHKDETICAKRLPVVPCFNAPDRMLQNRVGRALCFLIDQLDGHFNVAATQEISGRLAKFNAAVERHDTVMAASFDVKEMYVLLKPAVLLQATEFVVMQAMGDQSGVLVNTRGRRGVAWYAAGTPRRVAVKMTAAQILGVRSILDNGFLFVTGDLVRQVSGIGICGGASPGLVQCVCVFGEMQWTKSLGADQRLAGIKILGTRLIDDCTLLVARDCGGYSERLAAMRGIFLAYLQACYPDGMTVEQTSDGLSWVFCGMQLKVAAGEAAAVLRELRWQEYPKGWLFEALERMVARTPYRAHTVHTKAIKGNDTDKDPKGKGKGAKKVDAAGGSGGGALKLSEARKRAAETNKVIPDPRDLPIGSATVIFAVDEWAFEEEETRFKDYPDITEFHWTLFD